jgi:ribulose-5-phosphate 4-epimerase/fuculose-1-phosphate aldolase
MTIATIDTRSATAETDPHYEDRINLAAVFRMAARLNLHESVANHFSYAVSSDGGRFLINPFGRHFSTLRASELLLLDAHDDASIATGSLCAARTLEVCHRAGVYRGRGPGANRSEYDAFFQSCIHR